MLTFWAYCGTAFLDAARTGKDTAASVSGELSYNINEYGRSPNLNLSLVCRYD
jgi:hypothetical protein